MKLLRDETSLEQKLSLSETRVHWLVIWGALWSWLLARIVSLRRRATSNQKYMHALRRCPGTLKIEQLTKEGKRDYLLISIYPNHSWGLGILQLKFVTCKMWQGRGAREYSWKELSKEKLPEQNIQLRARLTAWPKIWAAVAVGRDSPQVAEQVASVDSRRHFCRFHWSRVLQN